MSYIPGIKFVLYSSESPSPNTLRNSFLCLQSSMASSLASMAARRAATLSRLSSRPSPFSQAGSLTQRRGVASAADHHGPPKVNCWQDPMNPAKWKEEHFVIVSLTGWGLLVTAGYKFFTGGKKNKEGNLVEASQ